jgi:hypothetical protein
VINLDPEVYAIYMTEGEGKNRDAQMAPEVYAIYMTEGEKNNRGAQS